MCKVNLLIPADTTVNSNKNKGDLKPWDLSQGISSLKASFHSKTLISSKFISSYKIKPDLTPLKKINFPFYSSYPAMARGTHEDNMSFSKDKELKFPANLSILCTIIIPEKSYLVTDHRYTLK